MKLAALLSSACCFVLGMALATYIRSRPETIEPRRWYRNEPEDGVQGVDPYLNTLPSFGQQRAARGPV